VGHGTVSMTKYEKAKHQLSRAHAKARESGKGGGMLANGVTLASAGVAGVLDQKMGTGTATIAGAAALVGGIALGQPLLVHVAVGALCTAAYRQAATFAASQGWSAADGDVPAARKAQA